MSTLVYWSSKTGNTHRFIERLGQPAVRLPISTVREELPVVDEPFVLVLPTFGDTEATGAVPAPVDQFLEQPGISDLLRGVIAAGNRNFGETYGLAGDIIAARHRVPCLYRFELAGMPEDVSNVTKGLETFWTR